MNPPPTESKLSLKAGAQCAQMRVTGFLDAECTTVGLEGTNSSLVVPAELFPFLTPGDNVVVHIGITHVAVEAVVAKPRLII